MTERIPITIALGDGIGPEIMEATLRILEAADAPLEYEKVRLGEKVFLEGNKSGIEPAALQSLRRTRILLKGPITTPQGGGYKSINVTLRKSFGLFANVRPCVAYNPFIKTKHPFMDVVIVRENEEDLYAGIEHRQTDEVEQCLKLISRDGCERIVRYALEYARQRGRRKVTCFTKDNIMKQTDGLFHRVFDEIGEEYEDLTTNHMIIDIGAAKLAATPELFDVIVMPNLYGDIMSDIAAQIAGSVGMAGSSNIGRGCAMFEAIHGSAPDIAGQNVANPSGCLNGAILMLEHLGLYEVADRIHNAWLRTIEDGVHTLDILSEEHSRRRAGTKEFADAVVGRLGDLPRTLEPVVHDANQGPIVLPVPKERPPADRVLVGCDIFLCWDKQSRDPGALGQALAATVLDGLELRAITNRGVRVWPDGLPETVCSDHWRCRFLASPAGPLSHETLVKQLAAVGAAGFEFIKTEGLYTFDGKPGYSDIPGI